jgi:hypothetical protein
VEGRHLPTRKSWASGSNTRPKRQIGAWRSPASALAWGARGPGFKSRRPDWKSILNIFCSDRAHLNATRDLIGTETGACEVSGINQPGLLYLIISDKMRLL